MKSSVCAISAAALIGAATASDASVTPVQKVIQLMQDMVAKGEAEKKAEVVQFAKYKMFCENTASEKNKAIAAADERIQVLTADIEKATTDAEELGKDITKLEDDIKTWNGDKDASTKVREIEKSDYDTTHKDYSESITALEGAIAVLKKQDYDRAQAALIQVQSTKIPESAKRAIAAYMQQEPADEGLAVSAPEAEGYEFQSGGIIQMLEKLLDKFVTERTTLEKEESDSKHAYEMLMQDLTNQIDTATADRDAKADRKAKKLQAKADAEGDLTDTSTTRAADQKYLDDLVATCEQKAGDFESRQNLRAEELVAVNKAIEIIGSEAVAGNADKHLPSMIQMKGALFGGDATMDAALVQLRSASGSSQVASQSFCKAFLQARASTTGSRILAAVAARVDADPFGKVRKMIKDLIVKLMEEAQEETEHKGWCDTELATNEKTRVEKTESVQLLTAEIDQLDASITKLTEDLIELTKAVADLESAMAEATENRNKEKAENTQTIEDAQAAQTAVAQALTVLKEFYAKAAEATAFVQQQPEAPEIFDSPYKGMGGESGGVVGMLEVIQSDFSRLEGDTKTSEMTAQKEYDQFIEDSKIDLAGKNSDIEHKTSKKQNEAQALTTKKGDLEATQKELDAALSYFDKLKPSCIDAGVSYEDRVARRKEEIESLQQALRILNGEDLA